MSKTLADVEAYQVYLDESGEHTWRDGSGYAYCRRKDGCIHTLHPLKSGNVPIVGDSLGHVRDEPWRKAADKGQPGTLTDAHNRIDDLAITVSNHGGEIAKLAERIAALEAVDSDDRIRALENSTGEVTDDYDDHLTKLESRIAALEQRPSVPEGFVQNCIDSDMDLAQRYSGLAYQIGELEKKVEPVNQCNAPPSKPTQPPDVVVYERVTADGMNIRYEVPVGHSTDQPGLFRGLTRTVIDAFDRLGWDGLRRWGLSLLGPTHSADTWDIVRDYETLSTHRTEHKALTAARAIARKEGWR